jgi:hypothetical protein
MEISSLGATGFRFKGKNSMVTYDRGVVAIGSDKPFKIDAPGEYEVQGISVIGINGPTQIYVIEIDGVRVAVLDKISEKLSDAQVEDMGAIDILVCSAPLAEVVSQVDPWVIVTEVAADGVTKSAKYSVSADKLPTETTTVVLERKD